MSATLFAGFAAFGLTAAVLTAVAPAPAQAKGRPVVVYGHSRADTLSRSVSYRDLHLATDEGERTLNRRVRYAVSDLCLEIVGPVALNEELHCKKEAWQSASPQIEKAVLRARQIATTGTSSIAAAAITISFK